MRIPNLTNQHIIRALLPGAKGYNYDVSHDDFDEYDNEGPGHYYGVEVADDVAQRWDAGIAACKAQGLETRSREGLALRHEVMHGTRELPAYLRKWLDERDALATAKAEAEQAKLARLAAYAEHKQGFTEVGPDEYTSNFWGITARGMLPLVAAISGEDTGYGHGGNQLLMLPNGDLMEIIQGKSWTRYSIDRAYVAERMTRKAIQRHRYSPELFAALWALEAVTTGANSWFGGGRQPAQPVENAYNSYGNPTGEEKLGRLLSWLGERRDVALKYGDKAGLLALIEQCLALAVPGSIVHES